MTILNFAKCICFVAMASGFQFLSSGFPDKFLRRLVADKSTGYATNGRFLMPEHLYPPTSYRPSISRSFLMNPFLNLVNLPSSAQSRHFNGLYSTDELGYHNIFQKRPFGRPLNPRSMSPMFRKSLIPFLNLNTRFSTDDTTKVTTTSTNPFDHLPDPPKVNLNLQLAPFKFKKANQNKKKQELDALKSVCGKKGGVLIKGECYDYIDEESSYSDARKECQKRGGDLWVPDLSDPKLINFLAEKLPEIAGAPDERVWIGALFTSGRVLSVEGEDITNEPLIQIDNGDEISTEGNCIFFDLGRGAIRSGEDTCSEEYHFVCEYPIKIQTQITIDKYLFNKKFFKN